MWLRLIKSIEISSIDFGLIEKDFISICSEIV